MKIIPKSTITFTKVSGGKCKILAGVPVDVDEKDIKHLDKADYEVGEVKTEVPTKKK